MVCISLLPAFGGESKPSAELLEGERPPELIVVRKDIQRLADLENKVTALASKGTIRIRYERVAKLMK